MALAIADAGADVIIAGRDEPSLEKIAEEIRLLGRQAWTFSADVADPTSCQALCERVVTDLEPIDILVNNVGGRRENIATEAMSLETWQHLMNLNLTSAFVCTKVIGGSMIKQGIPGRIINIASINSMVVGRNIHGRHYETSKAAMVQFTRATAADWAPHGITVNAICPGGFMTEPNIRWSREHPEVIEGFKAHIPCGDFGQPEDLGPLAVYLASDASRYMTGASLVIDGGYTLW